MTELDDFLSVTVPRHAAASTAVRSGDPDVFLDQLSEREPVTLFPAAQAAQVGRQAVTEAVRRVTTVYSGSTEVEVEVLAAGASGDLAYLVAHERAASSVAGDRAEDLVLRVTQVYRREDGEWRLVHRHADPGPGGAADQLRQAMRGRD
jgi:uncharacterized protein (TIGR02246 family)